MSYHVWLKEHRCKSVIGVRNPIPAEAIESARVSTFLFGAKRCLASTLLTCVELVIGNSVVSPSCSLPPRNKMVANGI